jgi:hypothetical protein
MKDNQEWISNQGNEYSNHPEGCTDDLRKVKVKLRDGTVKEGEVWRFHWAGCGEPCDIVSYQYIDEEQEPKKYYSQWLSNEGNTDKDKPNPFANTEVKVEVVTNEGKFYSGKVDDFYWCDFGSFYHIKEYRYVYDEPPETFDPEPDIQDTEQNTLKVLECKEEDNGDVTLKLKLGTEALKVLLEQGLRAIIKDKAEEELQRIKESTPKKG